jgi:hypothetical protein
MSDRGKIKSRANTGTCSQHQSDVALAIKNARELALLPYAVRTLAGDKSAGRRGRGGPGGRPDRPPAPAASTPPGSAGEGLVDGAEGLDPDDVEVDAPEDVGMDLGDSAAVDDTGDSSDDEVQG